MHIFLTGEKRVGKSTIIKKWLAELSSRNSLTVAGFITVRTDALARGEFRVHLLDVAKHEVPSEKNALFVCGKEQPDLTDRFDELGCAALQDAQNADIVIMDELGPHERDAFAFQSAVLRVLDSDRTVLGVLQMADCAFLERIKNHANVKVLTVTAENRDMPNTVSLRSDH